MTRKSVARWLAGIFGAAVVCTALSLAHVVDPWEAAAISLVVFGALFVTTRLESGFELARASFESKKRDGSRDEVSQLAWSLFGRDRLVTFGAMRFVRTVAARTLSAHGLSLDSPGDEERISQLIGSQSASALRTSGHTMTQKQLERLLETLENLNQENLNQENLNQENLHRAGRHLAGPHQQSHSAHLTAAQSTSPTSTSRSL